jgi:hypothetical protein
MRTESWLGMLLERVTGITSNMRIILKRILSRLSWWQLDWTELLLCATVGLGVTCIDRSDDGGSKSLWKSVILYRLTRPHITEGLPSSCSVRVYNVGRWRRALFPPVRDWAVRWGRKIWTRGWSRYRALFHVFIKLNIFAQKWEALLEFGEVSEAKEMSNAIYRHALNWTVFVPFAVSGTVHMFCWSFYSVRHPFMRVLIFLTEIPSGLGMEQY